MGAYVVPVREAAERIDLTNVPAAGRLLTAGRPIAGDIVTIARSDITSHRWRVSADDLVRLVRTCGIPLRVAAERVDITHRLAAGGVRTTWVGTLRKTGVGADTASLDAMAGVGIAVDGQCSGPDRVLARKSTNANQV